MLFYSENSFVLDTHCPDAFIHGDAISKLSALFEDPATEPTALATEDLDHLSATIAHPSYTILKGHVGPEIAHLKIMLALSSTLIVSGRLRIVWSFGRGLRYRSGSIVAWYLAVW